ncbi:MAG: glycosyltransferase family 4 protein, partial [bacterium]
IKEPCVKDSKLKILKFISYLYSHFTVFHQVFRFLVKKRNDFITIHAIGGSILTYSCIIASKLLRKKTMVECTLLNEPPVLQKGASLYKNLVTKLEKAIYTRADFFIPISPALSDQLLSIGIKPDKIEVVSNPVDSNKFSPPDDNGKQRLKKKLELIEKYSVFLFVGAIIRRKGVHLFPKMFRHVFSAFPNSMFVFAGEDNFTCEQKKNKDTLLSAANSSQIRFVGNVDNVNEFMKVADFFIFPTLRESLGNVVLEAMATGVPVLMNELPGISDFMIESGKNGFIIPDNNPHAYYDIICKLVEHPELYKNISRNAVITAKTRFSIENRNIKINRIYDKTSSKS